MSFLQPYFLVALLLLPVGGLVYWWLLGHGRSEGFVWFPGLRPQVGRSGRRHLAAGLYGLAIGLAVSTLARPYAALPVWDERSAVVLTIDVSHSMRADDIRPSRLGAAKQAAKVFVEELPKPMWVALVSFAQESVLESPLTRNRSSLVEQIEQLEARDSTAIGEALVYSLEALDQRKFKSASTIILLSDGRNRMGIAPKDAAAKAKKAGVKVHTIGVGSADPFASNLLPGADFDEAELRSIAETTGGEYFAVDSAEELKNVYRKLGKQVGLQVEPTEVSGVFALVASVCLAGSLLLGAWSRRII